MNGHGKDTDGPFKASLALRIESVCERFEASYRAGERPEMGPYFAEFSGPERTALAEELSAIAAYWRERSGDQIEASVMDRRVSAEDPSNNAEGPVITRPPISSVAASEDGDSRLDPIQTQTSDGIPETRLSIPGRFPVRPDATPSADDTSVGGSDDRWPDAIPGYEVLEILGEGGMGIVWKARQVKLNRVVALKMILSGHRAGAKELVRFLAEAEAVASVRHPHVVQVHEYGESEGRPFLALEYLPGGSLTDRLKAHGRFDPTVAARLVATLAEAVQAAHDQGIVHRDLKPANVLFDAEGQPKVTDFGLAKRDCGGDMTSTHAVMGTPAYMAPEQAKGGTKFVGPQADVYSLGVILYECLTGTRPFEAPSTLTLLQKVVEEEPQRPGKRVVGLPRGVELACLKCLAKNPTERYQTAQSLAADLERFAAGNPVFVKATGAFERLTRWAKRKPTLAAVYMLGFLATGLGGFGGTAVWLLRGAVEARREATLARVAAETATKSEKQAREQLAVIEYGRTVQMAHQEWRENKVPAALLLLDGTRPDLRGWEWRYVQSLCHSELLTFSGHSAAVYTAGFSPDGSRVVTASGDKTVRLWDAKTGAVLSVLKGHTDLVRSVVFSPDGSRVLSAGQDKTPILWDAKTGVQLFVLKGHTDQILSATFGPDGSRVLTASGDSTAKLWDAKTGADLLTLKGHSEGLFSAAFNPDGSRVATASFDKTVRLWDAKTGAELSVLKGHTDLVRSVVFSPDGSQVLTASGDKTAKLWGAKNGSELFTLKGHSAGLNTALFSPDGSRVVTSSDDCTARIWDAKTGTELSRLKGHANSVYLAMFSPDGSRAITTSDDMTARVWDTGSGDELLTLKGHLGIVHTAQFSDDGKRVLTASGDGTARLWDAGRGGEFVTLKGHGDYVFTAEFSSDGSRILTAGGDMTAKLWGAKNGTELFTLSGSCDGPGFAEYSPDGSRILTQSDDDSAKIWDARSGSELVTLKGPLDSFITSATFSPDGTRVVAAYQKTNPRLWDATSGQELLTLKGNSKASVEYAEFSPDGSRILTGSEDGSASLWDVTTGRERLHLKGHSERIQSVAFSPDGSRILTASSDKTARLWDAASGTELLILKGHDRAVYLAEFSSDGSQIFTTSYDATARIWDAMSGALILKLKGHTGTVTSVQLSLDGSRFLTSSEDKTAKLWNAKTGAELLTLKGHTESVHSKFSPDGSRILTSSDDGTAKVWDPRPLSRQIRDGEPASLAPMP